MKSIKDTINEALTPEMQKILSDNGAKNVFPLTHDQAMMVGMLLKDVDDRQFNKVLGAAYSSDELSSLLRLLGDFTGKKFK